MNTFIDIYCERLGPGFWAEPLNALTNLSFFIAAFLVFQLARKHNALHRGTKILIVLLLCIGTGSFLFHTLAVRWAMFADTLPILFYQLEFIALYSAHVMRLDSKRILGLLVLFLAASLAFDQIPGSFFNGSLSYAPALLFLGFFAWWHRTHAYREKNGLAVAAAIFLISLTFRSLDMAVCPQIAPGLHFLWHILNGLVLYFTARAYILNARFKLS